MYVNHNLLLKQLSYSPTNGEYSWLIPPHKIVDIGHFLIQILPNTPYIPLAHLCWGITYGYLPDKYLPPIDGDVENLKISNYRDLDAPKSGVRGITQLHTHQWITRDSNRKFIGAYKTLDEAKSALVKGNT